MTAWLAAELPMSARILEPIEEELHPLAGKEILILCCGDGQWPTVNYHVNLVR